MTAAIWIPSSLLVIAAALDLRFGKFPNWLFVTSALTGLIWLGLRTEIREFMLSVFYSVLFFVALAPLVYFKVFGAGDIKLLTAFSLFVTVPIAATVLIYSLFWGLLLGLIKMALAGDLKTFTQSFLLRTQQVKSQKIPYAVAILMGWLSFLVAGDLL
ncbi:MAG: prepilin peptidase [Bdellovibrionaceae bacterium]|nr:prepilin peptidase [Pseudobdellovibrionaceae bacterium]